MLQQAGHTREGMGTLKWKDANQSRFRPLRSACTTEKSHQCTFHANHKAERVYNPCERRDAGTNIPITRHPIGSARAQAKQTNVAQVRVAHSPEEKEWRVRRPWTQTGLPA
eukprot:1148495-Pelagomonas_calceolata.AAC.5